jgi:hypothetical protein
VQLLQSGQTRGGREGSLAVVPDGVAPQVEDFQAGDVRRTGQSRRLFVVNQSVLRVVAVPPGQVENGHPGEVRTGGQREDGVAADDVDVVAPGLRDS